MASLESLKQARTDPRVRAFLEVIAAAEGTTKYGYHTLFGNTYLADLRKHPNIKKSFTDKTGKVSYTTAAGRYQFLYATWSGLVKQYHFPDFGADSQDLGAIGLLSENGALPYLLKGDFANAVLKARKTWASFPGAGYNQGERSMSFLQKAWAAALGAAGSSVETVGEVAEGAAVTVKANPATTKQLVGGAALLALALLVFGGSGEQS